MKINFSQMYEGWKNNLFPANDMKTAIKDMHRERKVICEQCEWISTKHKTIRPDVHCTDCGCTLSAKTRCLSCECPLKKWGAYIKTQEEEQIFLKNIYGK